MKKILLAFIFCFLSIFTFANDWEFGSEGEHIIPLKGSNIAIKKESKANWKRYKVKKNIKINKSISTFLKNIETKWRSFEIKNSNFPFDISNALSSPI